MYKLVLYVLIAFVVSALCISSFGVLQFHPFAFLFSTLFLVAICWIAQKVCVWAFDAQENVESVYITALIFTLIISPPHSPFDGAYYGIAMWASILGIASKFIFAVGKKHVFNPVALAVFVLAITVNHAASWWIGTVWMLPVVCIGGALIARKIHRFDLVLSFFAAVICSVFVGILLKGGNTLLTFQHVFLDAPVVFFAFVMLTEPLTTPPTRHLRILYGAIVGALFAPWIHFGSFYITPEFALLIGNVYSYAVSPKAKLFLKLKEKVQVADSVYDYIFEPVKKFLFTPGQYLEWTLAHASPDSRGNRRYFTIASSPTEQELRMGVKFYPNPSSFKKELLEMQPGDVIVGSQLSGDFVLPKNPKQKLVFVAGGIGITPFRSIIKYLVDTGEKRDIVLLYSNKCGVDIAYQDVFSDAAKKMGLKTVCTLTDVASVSPTWKGKIGYVDATMMKEIVPDFKERYFYLSGPHAMVTAFEKTLRQLGIAKSRIKKDYFPGFA